MSIAVLFIENPPGTLVWELSRPIGDVGSLPLGTVEGFGLTAAGRAYYDPENVDAGDEADLVITEEDEVLLYSRTRENPVTLNKQLVHYS